MVHLLTNCCVLVAVSATEGRGPCTVPLQEMKGAFIQVFHVRLGLRGGSACRC